MLSKSGYYQNGNLMYKWLLQAFLSDEKYKYIQIPKTILQNNNKKKPHPKPSHSNTIPPPKPHNKVQANNSTIYEAPEASGAGISLAGGLVNTRPDTITIFLEDILSYCG